MLFLITTAGALKSDYRRFNIENITGGDDYAAMEQAIRRRYTRLMKGEGKLPDILLIDGGKGQIGVAKAVLSDLGVVGVMIIGVAKGDNAQARNGDINSCRPKQTRWLRDLSNQRCI